MSRNVPRNSEGVESLTDAAEHHSAPALTQLPITKAQVVFSGVAEVQKPLLKHSS